MSRLIVHELGRMPYEEAWALQRRLAEARADGGPDRLLLVEHPPVYTLGTRGDEANVLWGETERAARGIALVRSDRGGDVTYHGPGQLVIYPILQLSRQPGQVHAGVVGYVRQLEQTVIAFLATYGVSGCTLAGLTGVWIDTAQGMAKIAAIGVRVNVKAVTMHGIGLNLNTDLSHFDGIIACGLRDRGVTRLADRIGGPVDEPDARRRFVEAFAGIFERDFRFDPAP